MRTAKECEDILYKYIDDILTDKIPVCKLVKQTYQRHLEDLERSNTTEFSYQFDIKRGAQVIKFCEVLKHVSGPMARKRLVLENWQIAMLMVLYGWVDKKTKYRRFTKAHVFVPRKNGKSFLLSALALYHLIDPRDGGSQIYSVSTKRDMAKLTFDVSRQIIIQQPELQKAFKVDYNAQRVFQEISGSYFKALSKDTHGQYTDGLSSSFVIFDEAHLIESRHMYDSLITSTGARAEPLVFCITTAGFSRTSVGHSLYEYGKRILSKEITDDSVFFLAYTLDEEDLDNPVKLLTDEYYWHKANPNLGVSCFVQDMKNLATQALNSPVERPNFFTKRLNIWTSSSSTYIASEQLEKVLSKIDKKSLRNQRCILGIDAASRNDFFALGLYFPATDNRPAIAFNELFLNKKAIESDIKFTEWADQRLIIPSGDIVTDYEFIYERIEQLFDFYDITHVFYDEFSLSHFAAKLKRTYNNVYKHYQNAKSYHTAMTELVSMISNKEIIFEDTEVFRWQMSNVVAKRSSQGYLHPTKINDHDKIDGVVALLMAIGGFMRSIEHEKQQKTTDWSVILEREL